MITLTLEDSQRMTGSNRLICRGAIERGWRVYAPYVPTPHMFIDRGDGRRLHIFSATPPDVSYAAAHMVNDKYATYVALDDAGIRQLRSCQAYPGQPNQEALTLLSHSGTVVVKPIDGGHGMGITVGVNTPEGLQQAIGVAAQSNRSMQGVVVQSQYIAQVLTDIRIVCIGGAYVAAVKRIPARVFGDGVSTVLELVRAENQRPERGEAYRSKLTRINEEAVRQYLGEGCNNVPSNGIEVRVLGIANYGAGGELVDVTDDVPAWMRQEAEQAASVLGLAVAGVDYLTDSDVLPGMAREQSNAVIIEVNKCPALAMHDEPTVGVNRHVTERYLDYLSSL